MASSLLPCNRLDILAIQAVNLVPGGTRGGRGGEDQEEGRGIGEATRRERYQERERERDEED